MEDVGFYAASLLKYLNLQREKGQFCDCVLRAKQNTNQIHPAHRCVLAASSPVLGSILSSTGALVELQDPCLSDSVLASLLDYIYTGVLPSLLNQQQFYRLLTAASHLQMKELQEALTAMWTQVNTEDNGSSNRAEIPTYKCKTYAIDLKTFEGSPLLGRIEPRRRLEEMETKYSSSAETFRGEQMNPAGTDSSGKDGEKALGTNDPNLFSGKDECTLNTLNTFYVLDSIDQLNTNDERKVTYLVQQNMMLNNRITSEVQDVPGVKKEMSEYQHHSDNFVRSENWQRSTKDRKGSSSSSSKSSHLCCEAVPVICHSGRAEVLQLAVSSRESQSSVSSSITPISSSNTDNDNTVKGCPTKHKDQDEAGNQDPGNNEKHIRCTIYPELNNGFSCSNTDQLTANNNEHFYKTPTPEHNNLHTHCDCLQIDTKHLNEDLLPENKDWRKCLKHQLERDFEYFPFKHRQLDCFGYGNMPLPQNKDWRAAVPLPMQDSGTGSESHCDVKEEHNSFSQFLTETDVQDSLSLGSEISWCPNISEAKKSQKDTISIKNCTETIKAYPSSTIPSDKNKSDTTSGTIGQSYSEHLQHQWLPHEDTHFTLQDSDHKHSQPSIFSHNSDDLSNEEKVGSFASLGQRAHILSTENTDQVLLLDINTRPGELLVTCEHRSDTEEKGVTIRDKGVIRSYDKTQRDGDPSELRAEGFDETSTHRNVEKTNYLGEGQCRISVAQKVAVVEASSPKEGEVKLRTRPVCSHPSIPDSVQASMSSTLSICTPCSLSASAPTDRSSHVLSPNHPTFQCSLCDRSFSQRGSLNRHVRSHLGVRPFPCPCCHMTFSRQYRVTEHMRVHQRCTFQNGLQKTPDSSIKNNEKKEQN